MEHEEPGTGRPCEETPGAPTNHVEILVLALVAVALSLVLTVGTDARVRMPGPVSGLAPNGLPPLCPSEALWDLECPGCGMTRAFVSMAHGRFVEAWDFNRGGPLFFLIVVLQIPYRLHRIRSRRPLRRAAARCLDIPTQIVIVLMIGGWLWDLATGGLT